MNTALKFCYQLQGFAEIVNQTPTKTEWDTILCKLQEVEIDSLVVKKDVYMAPEVFVIWLKGFVDIVVPQELTDNEWQTIKDHLQLVFTKVTPNYKEEKENLTDNVDMERMMEQLLEGLKDKQTPITDYQPPFRPHYKPYCTDGTGDKSDLICACTDRNTELPGA